MNSNSDTEVMYEPALVKTNEGPIFKVSEQPANSAFNILDTEAPAVDSTLAFDPENPAEWQPAVALHAEAYIKGILPEELAQLDLEAVAEEFLTVLRESSKNPILLDRTMRAMILIDQKLLLPVLQAELQKAARTVTPGLNRHTDIPISSV